MRSAMIMMILVMLSGCGTVDWFNGEVTPTTTTTTTIPPVIDDGLPTNPVTGDDLPNSLSESWRISRKDYDGTYRVRVPTTLWKMGIGEGSYVMVNDVRAKFRGFDTDNGARSPKYTLLQSEAPNPPVTCVVYSKDGKAVAWFKNDYLAGNGHLPNQGGE